MNRSPLTGELGASTQTVKAELPNNNSHIYEIVHLRQIYIKNLIFLLPCNWLLPGLPSPTVNKFSIRLTAA
jgi:hypothetical protein